MSLATPNPSPTTGLTEQTVHSNGSQVSAPTAKAETPRSPERASARSRKWSPYLWIGGAGVLIVIAVGVFVLLRLAIREPYSGPTWTVVKEKLRVTIVERGSLESAENSDIICRVKAKSQGSTVASSIKWVIEDGTQVKAGDKLMELDDSGFQETLKTQRNTKNQKYADWIAAQTTSIIVKSQNESDEKTAEVNRDLAELNLRKYVGNYAGKKVVLIETREALQRYLTLTGVFEALPDVGASTVGLMGSPLGDGPFLAASALFPGRDVFENHVRTEISASDNKLTSKFAQTLSDIEGKIENARSDRELWLDKASWSMRMVQKGFYSRSQADSDQSRLASMEIALRKVQAELDIFRRFDLEGEVTDLWSKLKEAERALKRVKTQAISKMETARADESAKNAIYHQETDRLIDMEREAKYYRITSPQNGMVVYFVAEQSRMGSGTQQGIVAQGEPVREGQKLIRIPNLAKMLVNVRVHEAMVSRVRGEKTKATGYGDTLRASFSFGRGDLFGLAGYHLGFEELRDDYFKDKEVAIERDGQSAKIRIDAFPGKHYKGNVKTVATVASSGDFFSSDIKVYPTMVSIESAAENLKPGMSAEVTIVADETTEPVLVMPIQAVVGSISMGAKRKCYVIGANGMPQERDIVVGLSNDRLVEVMPLTTNDKGEIVGVREGEKVVQNPRSLIPEKSDMKPGTPGTRRGAEFGDDGGAGGKKVKKLDKGPDTKKK